MTQGNEYFENLDRKIMELFHGESQNAGGCHLGCIDFLTAGKKQASNPSIRFCETRPQLPCLPVACLFLLGRIGI